MFNSDFYEIFHQICSKTKVLHHRILDSTDSCESQNLPPKVSHFKNSLCSDWLIIFSQQKHLFSLMTANELAGNTNNCRHLSMQMPEHREKLRPPCEPAQKIAHRVSLDRESDVNNPPYSLFPFNAIYFNGDWRKEWGKGNIPKHREKACN